MKKYLILLVFSLSHSVGFSQDNPVELWRNAEFVEEDYFANLKLDQFNNVSTICTQSVPQKGYALIKYDSMGGTLWKHDFSFNVFWNRYSDFTLDNIGNTYVSVLFLDNPPFSLSVSFLVKHDLDGEIVWEKTYGSGTIRHIEMDTLGRLIVVGQNVSHDSIFNDFGFIYCLNLINGDIIWQKTLSGWYYTLDMKMLPDKIEIVSFIGGTDDNDPLSLEITQVNYDGNLIQKHSKKLINPPPLSLHINPVGEIILGTEYKEYAVTKINHQVDTLWHYVYLPNTVDYARVAGITEDTNGDVYTTGLVVVSDSLDSEMLTTKFSPSGELLWQKKFNVTNRKWRDGGQVIVLDSLYAYAAGWGSDTINSVKLSIIVYDKTSGDAIFEVILSDSIGTKLGVSDIAVANNKVYYTAFSRLTDAGTNVITGCVKFPSIMISATNLKENPAVSVFPNPSAEMVHITGLDPQQFERVDILDMQGNLIVTQQVSSEAMSIPLGAVPVGTYVLVLRGDHITMSKQVVVVR